MHNAGLNLAIRAHRTDRFGEAFVPVNDGNELANHLVTASV